MVVDHTVSTGKPLTEAAESLGYRGVRMIPPPHRLLGVVFGFPKTGKSYLFQSNPDAFIFNTDLSSTSNPNPICTIWPGLDRDGWPCDPATGRIDHLIWEHVLEKQELILQMKADGDPSTPQCIVLDSMSTSIRMVMDWTVRNCQRLGISREAKEHWREMDGRAAWDETYNELVDFSLRFRRAGIGFYYVIHLINRIERSDEGSIKRYVSSTITENFWTRLFPLVELNVAIVVRVENEKRLIKRAGNLPDIPKVVPTRKHYLVSNDTSGIEGLLGTRVELPDAVLLPREKSWEHFVNVYTESAELVTADSEDASEGDEPSQGESE